MGNSSASQMGALRVKKVITNPLRTAVIPQSIRNYSFQAFSQVRHFQKCHTETQKSRFGLKPVT